MTTRQYSSNSLAATIAVFAVALSACCNPVIAKPTSATTTSTSTFTPPAMFTLSPQGVPKSGQCMEVDVPPGLVRVLWNACDDKYPRGPLITFSMVPQPDGTVVFEEQHFTNLSPGVSRQCLGINRNYVKDYNDFISLQDCVDGATNQHWKYTVDDTMGTVKITSAYGKYAGQCLVQQQTASVKQDSLSDYYPDFGLLPCDKKEPKGKGTQWLTPPTFDWKLTPVKKLETLFELRPRKFDANTKPAPKGSFKLMMPENISNDRCIISDNMSGFEMSIGTCISIYSDNPVAIFKTNPTKEGNIQFVEQHGKDCLTYRNKELMEGDVHIQPAGMHFEECKPDQLFQQWKFDEKAGTIASADPQYKGQCMTYIPKKDEIGEYGLTACSKATKFAKYTEYMYLDYYSDE